MSHPTAIILAYCKDNISIAKEIETTLGQSNFTITHQHCGILEENASLSQHLLNTDEFVVLLISDNFLKSTGCVFNSLEMLQTLTDSNRVLSVIINGQDGNQEIPTEFEKVSNVIQYMNYWQDQYLEMRKRKRTIDPSQEASFNEKLKMVRGISSEIGEFLRLLRTTEYISYEALQANQYETLFKNLGQEPVTIEMETTNSNNSNVSFENPSLQASQNNGDLDIQEEEEEGSTTQETIVETQEAFKQDETPEIDLSEIPGMDLLDQTTPSSETDESESLEEEEEEFPIEEEAPKEEEKKERNILLDRLLEYKSKTNGSSNIGLVPNATEQDLDELADVIAEEEAEMNVEISNSEPIDSLFEEEQKEAEDEQEFEDPTIDEREPEKDWADQFEEEPQKIAESKDQLSVEEVLSHSKNLVLEDNVSEGLKLLETAIEQHPKNSALRYQYALLLAKYRGDYMMAAHQLEELLQHDQMNKNAYYLLAELAEMNGDHLTSKNYFEKVITLDPSYYGVYYKLGKITLKHFEGQEKLAIKYFKKAIKEDKHNVDANYQYALLAHAYKGNTPKAIKHLKMVLKLDSEHPEAAFDLARIYKQLNEDKKASKYYALAILINPELQTESNNDFFNFKPIDHVDTLGADYGLVESADSEIEVMEEEQRFADAQEPEPQYPIDNGKVVLITGATSGIGRATAKVFAENGYRLILTGRRDDRLEEIQQYFYDTYRSTIYLLPFDVTNLTEVEEAVNSLPEMWKNVDILINNAGLAKGFDYIHEADIKDWDVMIDTNIKGLLYMTRAISPQMVKRGGGHIINIGSLAGKEVYPRGNVYSATKFAVDALTKAIRLDLYEHNIRVSQISPGYVEETEFALVRFDGNTNRAKIYEDFNPLTSRDVAETIYFMVTRPPHVNIQDVLIMSTQQAGSNFVDRKGRIYDEEE